ncbi:MAG: hypothetical protein ABSA14_07855 [Acidimicrobiales bacterium]
MAEASLARLLGDLEEHPAALDQEHPYSLDTPRTSLSESPFTI